MCSSTFSYVRLCLSQINHVGWTCSRLRLSSSRFHLPSNMPSKPGTVAILQVNGRDAKVEIVEVT